MKYIRLEEGIFQVGEKIIVEPNNNPNVSSFPNESGYYITRKNKFDGIDFRYAGESEVIKEADSIEELCDVFVTVFDTTNSFYKDIYPITYRTLDKAIKDLSKWDKAYNAQVMGAIWNNKGLIFVAKLNEDNVLELI